jgi:hypothetical protein
MSAFNVVRFNTKAGRDREFLDAHGPGKTQWPGLTRGVIVKIGESAYCLIAEWPDAQTLAAARPRMIDTLDTFRSVLVAGSTGVTDAVSGSVILTLK